MNTEENTQPTLRETLTAGVEKMAAEVVAPVVETSKAESEAEVKKDVVSAEIKDTRTAGRPRDQFGRLLPGKPVKEDAPKTEETSVSEAPKRPARPSWWKKDFDSHWEQFDPKVAEYIHERERQYQSGVSTYKEGYDKLKPLGDAISKYAPVWEQAGVKPHEALANLAETDRILRTGSKEDKLRLISYMAQSYSVPMQEMLVQGEDGKIYFNQQYTQPQAQQPQQRGLTAEEASQLFDSRMAQVRLHAAVENFIAAKDGEGKPLYPHFHEVKGTMDRFLRSGIANDLPSAYERAMLMPEHASLIEAEKAAKQQADLEAQARAKAEAATKARANTVSPRSQSPTGTVVAGDKTRKGLRDLLTEGVSQLSR